MKINGFDSSLSPLDNDKGQKKQKPIEQKLKSDSIELSTGGKKDAASANNLPVNNIGKSDKNRAPYAGYKPTTISDRDRIEISGDAERVAKKALVQKRITSGYYNNPKHLENLTDILLDKLNLNKAENE